MKELTSVTFDNDTHAVITPNDIDQYKPMVVLCLDEYNALVANRKERNVFKAFRVFYSRYYGWVYGWVLVLMKHNLETSFSLDNS